MKTAETSLQIAKPLIATTIAGLLAAPVAVQAFELKISGQVSRMVVMPDDAEGDETQHQDIGWSGSRFRITGSEEMANGLEVGFRLEKQMQSNPSSDAGVSGGATDDAPDDADDNRYQDIYFSGDFGMLSIGKGDGAADGSTEADLSGTALSSSSNHQDNWGNYRIAPGVRWDSIFTMADGISRVNRLRYDTPSFDGVRFAVSLDQGNATELGLKYTGKQDGYQLDLRAFLVSGDDYTGDTDFSGFSGSVLLDNGYNFTLAMSDTDVDGGPDRDALTIKLGYREGIHAFTVDFGDGETGSADADTFGLTWAAVVHPGVEVFATWRELDSDISGTESIDLIALGSRVRF